MPYDSTDMKFCLIQSDIIPDAVEKNLEHYRKLLRKIKNKPDVIIFPEMFACGFSPLLNKNAEPIHGPSTLFLQETAAEYQCEVVGSLPVETENKICNRLLWITPDKLIAGYYDKRHLYFGEEKEYCTPGTEKVIIQRNAFHFLPLICYDIRFPSWCRNRYDNGRFLYDCLLLIANFPAQRSGTLEILARARAIENQAFVILCNRVGKDGNGNPHRGKSMLINPLGKIVAQAADSEEDILECCVEFPLMQKIRNKFPIYRDWDDRV